MGKIAPLFEKAKEMGIFSKAVAGFILPDNSIQILPFNTPADTVFDIASLTKVCPTSTLALSYILEGKLSVDSKVIDFIPELQTNYREDIHLWHLLTHSLDYRVPMKTLRELPPEGILNALYNYQFAQAPGTIFNYGNPASVLLGIILSRVSGKDLQALGRELFFEPLQMTRSGWDPLTRDFNPVPKDEICPTEFCQFRNREIQGEIHDESAWVLRKLYPVGSAGMFSTVPDLLKFVQMILNDGKDLATGNTIVPAGILNLVSHNALPKTISEKTALGWELAAVKFMGTKISSRAFGKTGFTGASIVADPEQNASVILLSNFTHPHREANADRIHQFRAELANQFFSMI